MNDIQITDVTENSARLRWASPEPHNAYVFDLAITLAHDHSLVLKQNVTGTERVIGGLRSGQKYLVFITGYLKSQPKVTYTGTFSTSKFLLVKYQHSLLFFLPNLRGKYGNKHVRKGEINQNERSQPWQRSVVSLLSRYPLSPFMKHWNSLANAK